MVHQIEKRKFLVFLESFTLTVLIFLLGIFLGLFFEMYRVQSISDNYANYEIQSLDLKLQNYYYQIMDKNSCESAIEQNFIFADDLYKDGLRIEKYEEAEQLTKNIITEKKRYVLLKTELWLNSIILKEKCGNPFNTVVYFYSNNPDLTTDAQQDIISNILGEVKKNAGDKVVLLPIAGDIGLGIVDLQVRNYDINSFPAVLINENEVLYGVHDADEINGYLN